MASQMKASLIVSILWCWMRGEAQARTSPAKMSDRLAGLFGDHHVIDAVASGSGGFGRACNDSFTPTRGCQEFDARSRRDHRLSVRIARKCEGAVGQCENYAAMANSMAVRHIGAHRHGDAHASRGDLEHLDTQPLRHGIAGV